jgi:hypothetical protein
VGSERVKNRDWRLNPLNVRIDQVQNLAYLDALQLILSLFSKSFCDLWLPTEQFDHAQNTHRYGTAMLVHATPARRRHLTFCGSLNARICLFRGQPMMAEYVNTADLPVSWSLFGPSEFYLQGGQEQERGRPSLRTRQTHSSQGCCVRTKCIAQLEEEYTKLRAARRVT